MNGPEIERLIQLLEPPARAGPRSARRVTLHLLEEAGPDAPARQWRWPCGACDPVGRGVRQFDTVDPCSICADRGAIGPDLCRRGCRRPVGHGTRRTFSATTMCWAARYRRSGWHRPRRAQYRRPGQARGRPAAFR